MPIAPLVGAAAVTGGAGIVGGILQSRSASGAAKIQQQAADQALAFEREREARRRQEYDIERQDRERAHAAREQALNPYRQSGASVLARYGIQIPTNYMEEPAAAPPGMQPDLSTSGIMAMPGAPPGMGGPPMGPPPPPMEPPPGMTLGELTARRYGSPRV